MDTAKSVETLEEARQYIEDHKENGGVTCPCCDQFVKVYKRSVHSSMALGLIKLYHNSVEGEFVHLEDIGLSRNEHGDFAKLAYWKLVELKLNDDPSKRSTGMWKLTTAGRRFVTGAWSISKYVHVYNGTPLKFTGEKVNIRICLGNKFDYSELMK